MLNPQSNEALRGAMAAGCEEGEFATTYVSGI